MLDATSQPTKNRSPAAIKADNAIRSRLRISDPGNVDEVAGCSRTRTSG